jgi:hypothetical protein
MMQSTEQKNSFFINEITKNTGKYALICCTRNILQAHKNAKLIIQKDIEGMDLQKCLLLG